MTTLDALFHHSVAFMQILLGFVSLFLAYSLFLLHLDVVPLGQAQWHPIPAISAINFIRSLYWYGICMVY
jgi:hypothetical protein